MGRNTLSAQDLDKIISILYRPMIQDDTYGTIQGDWVPIADKIHANLLDIPPTRVGMESQVEEIRIANRPTRVRIRFRTDITSDMRVIVHTPAYRLCKIITIPAELGRKDGLEFVVEEYTTQGDAS